MHDTITSICHMPENREVINQSVTSLFQNTTHSNNIVTGYKLPLKELIKTPCIFFSIQLLFSTLTELFTS